MLSIGEKLIEAREKKGQSLKDAEKETKIRAKYLEALEQNKFNLIPGDAYVKIFIREYAQFLGIDPAPLVNEYVENFESPSVNEKLTPINIHPPKKRYKKVVSFLLIALLFAAGGFFISRGSLWTGQEEKAAVEKKAKTNEEKSSNEADEAAQAEQQKEDTSAIPAPAPQPFVVKLIITGRKGTTVKTEVDGQVVFNEYLGAGQVREWSAVNQVILTVVNPGVVRVEKDGVVVEDLSQPITR